MSDEPLDIQALRERWHRTRERFDGWTADIERLLLYADQLRAKLAAVEEIHAPYGLYDECGHGNDDGPLVPIDTREAHGGNEPIEVEEIGWTCEDGKLQTVCRECHTVDGEADEYTSDGSYPCATLKALGVTE